LGSQEFGHQTERRRKRVMQLIVAVFAAAVLVIVGYRWKSERAEKPAVVPKPLPSNVSQQFSGYSYTRSDNGREIFTIRAARTVSIQGDVTVLNDVTVEVFGRTGNQHDLIRTRACDYNRKTKELLAEGNVLIELNAPPDANPDNFPSGQELALPRASADKKDGGRIPVFLETKHLSFIRQGSLVVTDAPVRFRAGDATGTAQGLDYATRDDWVELKRDVVIEMDRRDGVPLPAPLRLEAARLRFEKSTGIVTLEGPLEITQMDERVSAANGKVHLDARNRVVATELEGDVKIHVPLPDSLIDGSAARMVAEFDPVTTEVRQIRAEDGVQAVSAEDGRLTHLVARTLQVDFSGTHARPKGGIAVGDVRVISEATRAAKRASTEEKNSGVTLAGSKQDLTASAVRFTFAPGGRLLREAETVGSGKMVLVSGSGNAGPRVVSADPFVLDFDLQGRPAELRGLSKVKMVFTPAPSARPATPDAVTNSDKLVATFDSSGRMMRTIDQTGNFRFEQGDERAFAQTAHYDAPSETVTLTGQPRMEDDQTRATADRILINTATGDAQGLGHVQTSHRETPGKTAKQQADEPTNVIADRMLMEQETEFIHYEGNVRLWHGDNVIQSESVDMFKDQRRVRTDARVLATFVEASSRATMTAPKSGKAGNDQPVPVTIRSSNGLEYSDHGRKATFRGDVQLETRNVTLQADRMDIFFSPVSQLGSSEIDRAVAEGNVTVIQPGRRATGQRAEYFADAGKVVLSGGPPTLYDAQRGFTTGRQLTFFLRDDRVLLDGGDESPTLSIHRISQ
jgi:lipopolysaccharide export system protein LptA